MLAPFRLCGLPTSCRCSGGRSRSTALSSGDQSLSGRTYYCTPAVGVHAQADRPVEDTRAVNAVMLASVSAG